MEEKKASTNPQRFRYETWDEYDGTKYDIRNGDSDNRSAVQRDRDNEREERELWRQVKNILQSIPPREPLILGSSERNIPEPLEPYVQDRQGIHTMSDRPFSSYPPDLQNRVREYGISLRQNRDNEDTENKDPNIPLGSGGNSQRSTASGGIGRARGGIF